MVVTLNDGTILDSGFVMYPGGHARNTTADLGSILEHKWNLLGTLALADGSDVASNVSRLNSIGSMSASDLQGIYQLNLASREAVD
jgi:2-methylcitrate dehydratase